MPRLIRNFVFAAFFCLAALCVPVDTVSGDFWIARANRVSNTQDGVCAFSSAETLGKHHGIPQVDGLRDWAVTNKPHGADFNFVTAKLNELGVKWYGSDYVIDYRQRDFAAITKACDDKIGCIVGLVDWPKVKTAHAVILTSINPDYVIFFDTNDFTFYHIERAWFDKHWYGWYIVILKG